MRAKAIQQQTRRVADITLVTGPACSGKTTWVREHAGPNDLIIDFDAIATAISNSDGTHDYPEALTTFAFEARDAIVDTLSRVPHIRTYLIASSPSERDRAIAARTIELRVPAEECKRRARKAGRPAKWDAFIDAWWAKNG